MIKTLKLGFISLSALAVLAACGDGTQDEAPVTDDPVEDTQTPEEDTAAEDTTGTQDNASSDTTDGILNMEFEVSFDQAVQTFYDTFGENANIDEIDLDTDRGAYEYNISGWDDTNEYDMEIDAETGDIKEENTDPENDNDNDQDDILALDNILTPKEAMDIAVQEVGSDFVEDWKLENDDGLTVYEIGLENDDDITIDATTGDIIDR